MEIVKNGIYLEKYFGLYKGIITRDIESIYFMKANSLYIKPMIISVDKKDYYPVMDSISNKCIGLIQIDKNDCVVDIFIGSKEEYYIASIYRNRKLIFLFRKDED